MDIVERLRRLASQEDMLVCEDILQAADEIERLRGLLLRYQVANYIPEDCDLYAETKAVLDNARR